MNFIPLFFGWWYQEGYSNITAYFKRFFAYLYDQFSVGVALKTLFDVWKRDYRDTNNLSIQEKFQAFMESLVSRLVGFIVKVFILVAFLIVAFFSFVIAVSVYVVWFLYPLVILGLFILGFAYIFNLL